MKNETITIKRMALRSGLLASAAFTVLTAGSALAQEKSASQDSAQSQGLEEVVVVARRTEERLQTVPITVTAISGDQLRDANISNGADLQKLVPTLNVQQSSTGAGQSYSLRGVRTGVVTYFAEVPVATSAVDLQIWDLQSVQALSGPQGTLFGRNSTGGAILFVPQRPTKTFSVDLDGEVGNYNERQFTGVLNLPASDILDLRFGARITRRDGVVKNELGPDMQSENRDVYRASALFEPTPWLTNYTVADYSMRNEKPYPNITTLLDTSGLLGMIYGQSFLAQEQALQVQNGIRTVREPFGSTQMDEEWGISNNLTAAAGPVTLKYIFGYRSSRSLQAKSVLSNPILAIYGENETPYSHAYTNELQVLGHALGDKIDWVVGGFSSISDSYSAGYFDLFGPVGVPYSRAADAKSGGTQGLNSTAVYAQATWKIGQFRLTGGVRHTWDRQTAVQFSDGIGGACNLPPGLGVNLITCQNPLSAAFGATTYNVSLDYQVTDKVLVYATTRSGYNTGGFNVGIPDPSLDTYQPEHITDYELGVKADATLGGMPVRANVSIFDAKYTDIIRSANVFHDNTSYIGNFNAAAATMYGLQSTFQIRPMRGLT
jgi:iron complex outermembrane receptor protein